MYSSALQRRTKKNGFAYIITDFIQKKKKQFKQYISIESKSLSRLRLLLETPHVPEEPVSCASTQKWSGFGPFSTTIFSCTQI